MVGPSFPFPLAGLVHVSNRITQTRLMMATERLTVCVRAADLREHPRGRQFDMITEVVSDGDAVWTEVSTYLRREQGTTPHPDPPPQAGRETMDSSPERRENLRLIPTALWRVAGDTGRRYAAVSGDVNPIHMNPLLARLFGFKRAIAHGMWLKARCLAALEGRLPEAVTADVEFKSPLLLPSTVAFTAGQSGDRWSIAVANAKTGRPHLAGHVSG
jgi:acyl dehydratase